MHSGISTSCACTGQNNQCLLKQIDWFFWVISDWYFRSEKKWGFIETAFITLHLILNWILPFMSTLNFKLVFNYIFEYFVLWFIDDFHIWMKFIEILIVSKLETLEPFFL